MNIRVTPDVVVVKMDAARPADEIEEARFDTIEIAMPDLDVTDCARAGLGKLKHVEICRRRHPLNYAIRTALPIEGSFRHVKIDNLQIPEYDPAFRPRYVNLKKATTRNVV